MERQSLLNQFYYKALEIRTGRSIKRGELPESNTQRGLDYYSKNIIDITDGRLGMTRMLDEIKAKNQVWLDIGCGDAGAIYNEFTRHYPYTDCCEMVGITAKKTGYYFEHKSSFEEFHKSSRIKIIEQILTGKNTLRRVLDKRVSKVSSRVALITAFNSLCYFDYKVWASTLIDIKNLLLPGGCAFVDVHTKHMYKGKTVNVPANLNQAECESEVCKVFPNAKLKKTLDTQMNGEYVAEALSIWVTKSYKTS